ncbi:MAG TPA: GH1 family beta-glucosidase [Rhizomicrobium sp.]|nr:GH1 family beta-glucosidase [Rhizomicrobium sp.]
MDGDGNITRRAIAPLAAGAALAAMASCAPGPHKPQSRQFPKDFIWGAATSAFQIEGALDVDGRGPSIWDVFENNPKNIVDHSTAAVAADSYRRYKDDVALLKSANLGAYRFSIAWPRVLPTGEGRVNDKGLDYYSRLTDALLEAKITPYATLYHWDLPQALYEKGGWKSRDTAMRLADYAGLIADKLGDRLQHFIILNEAAVHTIVGHVIGTQAPGTRDPDAISPVTHHQNLGQGLAMQALRARRHDLKVGTTMALAPSRAAGPWWALRNFLPAKSFDAIWNGAYLDPLFRGDYPWLIRSLFDSVVKPGDFAITKQPVDFLGVNYYSPTYIQYDSDPKNPAHIGPGVPPKGVAIDAFGREIDPSGLSEMLTRVRNDYGNPPVLITENGCSDPLGQGPALQDDGFRVKYLTQHLQAVKAEMENGSPVDGFFVWSIIDNWEWDSGFTSKFGIVAMDRKTGVRTPKASYAWYGDLAKTGTLASA